MGNKEVYKMNGYGAPKDFKKMLNFVKGKSYEYMSFEERTDEAIKVKRMNGLIVHL